MKYILKFKQISKKDVPVVGGKNASLGEMLTKLSRKGVNIPDGFATTAQAYFYFLKYNQIDKELKKLFKKFNPESISSLTETGEKARNLILKAKFPEDLKQEIIKSYKDLSLQYQKKNIAVAVRSSATAEDLPSASFAGQHETYLNVSGEKDLLLAVKKCISSLFTDRAISYREQKGFNHLKIALSVGVQKLVRSDVGSAGVAFTLDTDTGFRKVVLVNSIWGLGEMVVKGKITPDQFYVFKPTLNKGYRSIIVKNLGRKTKKLVLAKSGLKEKLVSKRDQFRFSLTDDEVLTLAKWAVKIENLYGCPQDIEWAKDGVENKLYIVQSRPETVYGSKEIETTYFEYQLKTDKKPLISGIAIGDKIGFGKVRLIPDVSRISEFKKGEVLVTKMTDPDWTSIMGIASAIITDEGGRTCHAAIVSRELGIPSVVGTKNATKVLKNGQMVTVDCTQGLNGRVFLGKMPYKVKKYNLKKIPKLKTKIMVNIGAPEIAFKASFLPVNGVGLAREEFIIAEKIRIHPLALYHYSKLKTIAKNKHLPTFRLNRIIKQIDDLTIEYRNKKEFFIKELAEGIAQIAAAFYPNEVIVRFSDFKTNEYRNLIGGELFEEEEANPMLGFRGACRYLDKIFQPAFLMECQAIRRVREVFGLKNVSVMVPFCRTVDEGKEVINLIKKSGLLKSLRPRNIKIYVMCEIPSNVILTDKFLEVFDGMSIGTNDLTQLSLGLDRDNANVAKVGNETDPTIKKMVAKVIRLCNQKQKYCGICGDAPSTIPEFAKFLIDCQIPSMSLSPDAVIKTVINLSKIK